MLPKVLVLVLVIFVLAGGYFYWQKVDKVSEYTPVVVRPVPSIPLSPWKVYKNAENNFTVTYPKTGLIWSKDGSFVGECGSVIKEEKNIVSVDNFYKIKKVSFEGSLDEYLVSQRAKNAYITEPLADTGADEALKLVRLKPDFEIAVGYPPLLYTKAVFKRNDEVFLLQEIIYNPDNEGGCVQPSVVDPSKYPDIAKLEWDLPKSIKFSI